MEKIRSFAYALYKKSCMHVAKSANCDSVYVFDLLCLHCFVNVNVGF